MFWWDSFDNEHLENEATSNPYFGAKFPNTGYNSLKIFELAWASPQNFHFVSLKI